LLDVGAADEDDDDTARKRREKTVWSVDGGKLD
jgi:hypothetical protein